MVKHRRRGGDMQQYQQYAEQATDTTATFGRITMVFRVVVGTLVCILFILIGIFMVRSRSIYNKSTRGKVNAVECNQGANNCSLKIEFMAGDKKVSNDHYQVNGTNYSQGQNITIYYDETNPANFVTSMTVKYIGWLIISISFIIIIASWLWLYVVFKNRTAAAITGVAQGVDMVQNAFE